MTGNQTPSSLLGFEYQALVDDITKKSIGFQSTISKDCTQSELDSLLDKCRAAVTRQRIFAEIEAKEIDFRNIEEGIKRASLELYAKDSEQTKRAEDHPGRAGRGLSVPEQTERKAKVAALENGTAALDSLRARLVVLRSNVSEMSEFRDFVTSNFRHGGDVFSNGDGDGSEAR